MLTFTNRMNVVDRFKEYCSEHGIDYTPGIFLNWLGMMDLLNEEAIRELPEIKTIRKCSNEKKGR